MFEWLVVGCASCLFVWACRSWMQMSRYWAKRGVPHEKPLPLFGSLRGLMTDCPTVWFRKYYEKFRGSPYVGIWLLWQPALIINCPVLAKRILITDFEVFSDRNLDIAESDPIGHHSIFLAKGTKWLLFRKQMSTMFTPAKLKMFDQLISNKTNELMKRIKNNMESNTNFELRSMYMDFSTDIISEVLFGISSEVTLGGRSAMRDITYQFEAFSYFRIAAWRSIFFQPKIAKYFGFKFFPTDASVSFKNAYREASALCKSRKGSALNISIIDYLIKLQEQNQGLPEEMFIAQAAILLQGGFDTMTTILTLCSYELAFHSEIQEKLRKELEDTKRTVKDEHFSDIDLQNLLYFNSVIKETLRKYSSMHWLDRVASRDYKVDDKLTIPAGTPVYVNTVGMAYDADFYPEPYQFNPERFLNGNNTADPFTNIPFGEGPRHCIAKPFALRVLRQALSSLLLRYRLCARPGSPPPGDHLFSRASIFLCPLVNLSIEFVPL